MPIVVVSDEKNLKALTGRLLKANVSKAVTERAMAALREANPGLDLNNLTPGVLVVVPVLEGARTRIADVVDSAADGVVDLVADQVAALAKAAEAGEAADKELREQIAAALSDPQVQRQVGSNPQGEALLAELAENLAKAKQEAAARTEAMAAALALWSKDLDILGRLGGQERRSRTRRRSSNTQ